MRRIASVDHLVHGPARVVAELVHPTRHRASVRGRAPLIGEHTVAVLTALGYRRDEIDDLVAPSTVRIGDPVEAL